MTDNLKMTFDPMTIEHLGVRMYSTLPPVLAELIANSADAEAARVAIRLNDSGTTKEIIVEDDGEGMSFAELNEKFLRIGRNRRDESGGVQTSTTGKRKVIGKKGLGKLSFFGIATEIEVVTRKGGLENAFVMKWEEIKRAGAEKKEYEPTQLYKDKVCDAALHGTTITLRGIQRESDFAPDALAVSISRIFIVDDAFSISLIHNADPAIDVRNELKYDTLDKEIEWLVPDDIPSPTADYLREKGISGVLFATRKPISPKTNMRGITLFSRKKLVNNPEYFSDSTSSHFFSYLTGQLEVDFVDELPKDVIATDRQSLNWGVPDMATLRDNLRSVLNWMEHDWRGKRAANREGELTQRTGINVTKWLDTMPPEIRDKMTPVIRAVVKDSELPEEAVSSAARLLHEIIPEYPRFHWRNLHPEVQAISRPYYISGDYYTAFMESVKRYVNAVKLRATETFSEDERRTLLERNKERNLLENVFQERTPKLSVTQKFKKPNNSDFSSDTLDNIHNGHRMLALGVWLACRCPIAHEEVVDLRDSGLFTEKDCLDALGLVSHLFHRLDNAEVPPAIAAAIAATTPPASPEAPTVSTP